MTRPREQSEARSGTSPGRPVIWHWPPALEATLIRRFTAGDRVKAIARDMGRPLGAVASHIERLRDRGRLPYRRKPGARWSARELELLIEGRRAQEEYRAIAPRIGRTPAACKVRMWLLLAETPDLLDADRDQLTLRLEAA